MLHFEGDKEFALAPAALWTQLSDCRFLARCISEAVEIRESEPHRAVCVLRPGFSFVRGTIEITLQVEQATPERDIRYHVHGKGIGSSNDVTATLALTPKNSGTHIHWSADITQLGGLLKAVPVGLIQASAQKVIDDLWMSVEGKLSGPA
jgi:carbon monoxide dehydrogenase subunit G